MRRFNDLKISRLGFGAWQIGEKGWGWERDFRKEDVVKAFERAFELGVNFIDTAEVYGSGLSEEIISEVIKERRDKVFLATKVGGHHARHDDVLKACEASLRRLRISTIDLYQVHWVNSYVPIRETMSALDKLLSQGKIRYVGLSNFPVPLIKEAQSQLSKDEIVSNQVRYNLVQRDVEKDIVPYCKKENIAIIAYSPLAQGLLTGKYGMTRKPEGEIRGGNPIFSEDNLNRAEVLLGKLDELARHYHKTMSQIALNWLLHDEDVYPIPGIKNTSQVEDNAGALGWQISDDHWRELKETADRVNIFYYP